MASESEANERIDMFERLVRSLEPEMLRAVWRVCRDTCHSEDALQNALLVVWNKLEVVRSHPHPKALILKICIDEAWTVRRRWKSQMEWRKDFDLQSIEDPLASSEKTVLQEEELAQIYAAMEQLSEQQSRCLWLRCVEQFTYEQIANVADCTEATVRKHIERARTTLRKKMLVQTTNSTRTQ